MFTSKPKEKSNSLLNKETLGSKSIFNRDSNGLFEEPQLDPFHQLLTNKAKSSKENDKLSKNMFAERERAQDATEKHE
jgi:hypothetical protein